MAQLSPSERRDLGGRFHRFLKEHRLPITRQRARIAEALFRSAGHPSVHDIQASLNQQGQAVGTATVYRTLDLLVESGLARAHDFGEGFKRFEADPGREGHEHLICRRCGAVLEFANERLERMLPIISDEHAFLHERHHVEIYGVCHECRQRGLPPL